MEDHSAIPVLEDEAIQFDFLLVDPQDDHVSVDAFLCIHRNNSEKCMQMDDIPCKFGGINFGTDREQLHPKAGEQVPDIKASEIEAGEFEILNGLSSFCEDYLLDGEYEENGTELNHDSGAGLLKVVSGNNNQTDRPGANETSQKSDSSATTDQVDVCQRGLNVNDSDLHGIFSCTGDSEKSLDNCWFQYPTFTVENMEEDVSSVFSDGNGRLMSVKSGLISEQLPCRVTANLENRHIFPGQEVIESRLHIDGAQTHRGIQGCSAENHEEKRLRKPPKRFIDELSEPKSKSVCKKREVSAPNSKDKLSNVKAAKHHYKKSKAEVSFAEDPIGIAIQVPFGPLEQNESKVEEDSSPVKVKLDSQPLVVSSPKLKDLELDREAPMSESEEDNTTAVKSEEDGFGRRKHHVLWTVSEVKMLIDGVSQYGVGRWSRIKKDLFSSSAHRTPVDLKVVSLLPILVNEF
ncbi:OLC1v1034536C1 [Oldenlandia corymbosa var. corymbosa]|uniref:OLC1v1034536C1 n=1 Tax=Oldenlandia corymbosa var. corymbosa TaxID=529605 RepID=A0AAV1CRI3_OLDCO|nr:OLC1v1034536C1 [Oldenlandia corymbosa var. corymbosa]